MKYVSKNEVKTKSIEIEKKIFIYQKIKFSISLLKKVELKKEMKNKSSKTKLKR